MCALNDSDPVEQLEENLLCAICLETLKDPRTLSCFHSFCKICLDNFVNTCRDKAQDAQPLEDFNCPSCRGRFHLAVGKSVGDMPTNHFICNMVEVLAVFDRGTSVPCSHNCSKSFSVARCVTCERFLCRQCLTDHNNYRGNSDHDVLSMDELSRPENQIKIKGKTYCKELGHEGKTLKFYCETCDQLICRYCMDFNHQKPNHSCRFVKEVVSQYKQLITDSNEKMEDLLEEGKGYLPRLSFVIERLSQAAQETKSQINKDKEALVKRFSEMLDEKAQALVEKVDKVFNEKRSKLQQQEEGTTAYVDDIKRSVQLSRKLLDRDKDEEILSTHKMVTESEKNLLANRSLWFKPPVTDAEINLCRGEMNEEEMRSMVGSLGEVKYNPHHMESPRDSRDGDPPAGNQPEGTMTVTYNEKHLPGFDCDTIVIDYLFPNGTQGADHPNPGVPFVGTSRRAFLPNNEEGRKILDLLKKAFECKLTFTVGRSRTTGRDNVITWNGIRHKTSPTGGPKRFGYPDEEYLKNVTADLAEKGIS